MTDGFQPNMMTTGIGSLPQTDPGKAVDLVLDSGVSIPFWPQLPKRDFLEGMIPQFSRGMPCVRVDATARKLVLDSTEFSRELERFYEDYLTEDREAFAMSEEDAAGLAAFQDRSAGRTWPVVKGQVTGPITFTTGIADAEKNTLYADPQLRDAAVKLLVRKTQWQMDRLRPFAQERVLMFVDEPVLAAYGSSAYVGISADAVREMLGEVFAAIASAGGISGVHVCGNSDWGVVLSAGMDVLNFDAYQHGESLSLYPEAVRDLFDRGGVVAWGIVPTTEAVREENADSLLTRLRGCLDALKRKGFPEGLLRERALLTPSCGAGGLSVDDAHRVFELLRELRDRLSQ